MFLCGCGLRWRRAPVCGQLCRRSVLSVAPEQGGAFAFLFIDVEHVYTHLVHFLSEPLGKRQT